MKYPLGNKLYYSISEVAQITELQPYTLRAWEKEFPCLRPRRLGGKNRAYRQRDISIILLIRRLLYEERFTIQGARQKLKSDAELVRQAVGQADWLQPADRGAVEAPDEDPENAVLPAREETGQPLAEIQARHALEEVRKELRAILHLLS